MTAESTPKNSTKNHMGTPQNTFDFADHRWGPFDLDAAADDWNAKLSNYYHDDPKGGGLHHRWKGRVWCNPPWGDIEPWVKKAVKEFDAGRAEVVCLLLPTRTGTGWWAKYAHRFAITCIRGRLRFKAEPGTPQGSGGFEDCAFFVLEHPPKASDLND